MTTTTKSKRTKRAIGENREESLSQIAAVTDVSVASPVRDPGPEETGVQPAYMHYVHARDGLASALKGKERQDRFVYEDAKERYRLYQEHIETANRTREKTEREALDVYRQTVDTAVAKASLKYRETMKRASLACKEATDRAWKGTIETSSEMSCAFYDDKLMPTEAASTKKNRMVAMLDKVGDKALRSKKKCMSSLRRGYCACARMRPLDRFGSQKTASKFK